MTIGKQVARGAFWSSAGFYGLIAFEFFYMASPFAAFFYGAYEPWITVLMDMSLTSWLAQFFLPHIVAQSRSLLIDGHTMIGGLLIAAGLVVFCGGAFQIYRNKIRKGEAVVTGLYRWIRHPQYIAFIVSALGMVLIWPRFLVLFGFVTLSFAYLLLARLEERICLRAYPDYATYQEQTGMLLPNFLEKPFRFSSTISSKYLRNGLWVLSYILTLSVSMGLAVGLKYYTLHALYTYSEPDAVYVSVGEVSEKEISKLAEIAHSAQVVKTALAEARRDPNTRFLNYLLPTEMYVSEIPLYIPSGVSTGHRYPEKPERTEYKIIFTKIQSTPGPAPSGLDIIDRAINKIPVIEVWVNGQTGKIIEIHQPPQKAFYSGFPVPVF